MGVVNRSIIEHYAKKKKKIPSFEFNMKVTTINWKNEGIKLHNPFLKNIKHRKSHYILKGTNMQ